MKKIIYVATASLLFVAGLGLLILTNIGFLTLRKPYIVRQGKALVPEAQTVAFLHVNVVPMDQDRVLVDQTVITRDGLIERVGPAGNVPLPAEALVVDGQGGYLMPGLVDMHVHIKEENELLLYVAHGVTAIRDLWGTTGMQLQLGFPDQLLLRSQIRADELLGPTLYAAGPIMEGEPKTNPLMPVFGDPEKAADSVRQQKAQGYDFIKVYDNLTPEIYATILGAAQEEELPVVGHVPRQVGLERTLTGGQVTIEHLTGYIEADTASFLIPEERLAEYAAMTRQAGVWVCPTIGVYQKYVPDAELNALEALPEMAYVSPRMKILWRRMLRPGSMQNVHYAGDYPARIDEIFTQTTRLLHENGVGIILGTDAGNPYVIPGASLLDELDYLAAAGFSPYEALKTGTRNAAEALGKLDEFGTVREGKRADLILLKSNPLESVIGVRHRLGVMTRGYWLPEADLQSMLAELVTSYSPTLFDRLWPLGLIVLAFLLIYRKKAWLAHSVLSKQDDQAGARAHALLQQLRGSPTDDSCVASLRPSRQHGDVRCAQADSRTRTIRVMSSNWGAPPANR